MVGTTDEVSGTAYKRAAEEMSVVEEAVQSRKHKGFSNKADLIKFVKEYNLGHVVYNKASQSYSYVRHDGLAVKPSHWRKTYSDVLYYWQDVPDSDKQKRVYWEPEGYEYFGNARWIGEDEDGTLKPMFHRDYFTPYGYFDKIKGTFNIAKPSTAFAVETGRCTKSIYRLLKALCNYDERCYISLLSWLREKIVNPTDKIGVVPIFHSYAGGTGKSAFGDVICRGLFGSNNILVTHQFDVDSRFNSDQVDKLVVCIEEHTYESRRNNTESLKSSVTATTVRKENKGVDPVYQKSYTDYCMSTNKDVAVRLDDLTAGSNRRFFMMDGDENFRRECNKLADDIFTQLYGADEFHNSTGRGFADDPELISQFKYELVNNEEVAATNPRKFPRDTDANKRAYYVPRKTDAVEVESILRSIIPFAKKSIEVGSEVPFIETIGDNGDVSVTELVNVITPAAVQFTKGSCFGGADRIGFNRSVLFQDTKGNAIAPPVIDRVISGMREEFAAEGIETLVSQKPPAGGFTALGAKLRHAPTLWFKALPKEPAPEPEPEQEVVPDAPKPAPFRTGARIRFNAERTYPDIYGPFETVNEMLPGKEFERRQENCAHIDTFLLESDTTTEVNYKIEDMRIKGTPEGGEIKAAFLFENRLTAQRRIAENLFKEGIAARVVYSGCKSYHILVRVSPAPNTLEERKWLDAYLRFTLSRGTVEFDPQVGDAARLTRAPVTKERRTEYRGRIVTGLQKLLHEDWSHVYYLDWQKPYAEWRIRKQQPAEQRGIKMVPTAQKYVDACYAILKADFFSNNAFNGRRNELFFAGYRLCRSLGFGHDELWDCIDEDLVNIIKQDDYHYWYTRRDSDIIRNIDNDYEDSRSA